MQLIDTHGHLYLPEFEDDLKAVVERATEAGVIRVLLPDIDSGTTHMLQRTQSQFPDFFAAMTGIHPTSVKHDYQKELDHFESVISSDFPWVGIGEIGIDLYWDQTYLAEQKIVFDAMLSMAAGLHLPVSIHQRQSMHEVLDILGRYAGKVRGIMHCFSGSIHEATQSVNMGFKLGIGGSVTYKNSQLPEVISAIGLQHLVLETDAPYLAPVPHRGKRNEPSMMINTASMMAQIFQTDIEKVAETTTASAREIFTKLF